ncbi:hypothetical protein AncyloWKF20_06480 [Ancylobacter sp. WKF20]|uniref:hypothetical protein n=1 Tax=Ancylobacter sp. WKF20 TaxID=3039801 RepID=UPI0024343883|nr:hypothetical protein [Ancylobacter sp. WKF20]WGD31469.1 hypothetical protein AncyloWKF20_06480 [Ancylobacter sp. WKF20]
MDAALVFIPVVALGVALIAGGLVLHFRTRLRTAGAARIERREGALHVPLIAAFSGWKGIPWVSWARSNVAPRLVIHAEHVECRVIRTRRKPLSLISRVDYRATIGTENIVLEFSDSLTSFVGNTANRALTREALAHLAGLGCPLSERARLLVEKG